MNKHLQSAIIILAAALGCLLCCCTHNNGDIGPKFGLWKQTSMTVDGEPDPAYGGNILWGFQHGSLTFTTVSYDHGVPVAPPDGSPTLVFTSWSEADGYLVIDTDYSDGQGTFRYTPPAVLRLPAQTSGIRLKIISESSGKMELEYITPDGLSIRYSLQKWG